MVAINFGKYNDFVKYKYRFVLTYVLLSPQLFTYAIYILIMIEFYCYYTFGNSQNIES